MNLILSPDSSYRRGLSAFKGPREDRFRSSGGGKSNRIKAIVPGRTCRTIGWSVDGGGSITRKLRHPPGLVGRLDKRFADHSRSNSRDFSRVTARIRRIDPASGGPLKGFFGITDRGGMSERFLTCALHNFGARGFIGACLAGVFLAQPAVAPISRLGAKPAVGGLSALIAASFRSHQGRLVQGLYNLQA